ncbi:hypothetical protein M8C13_19335 [Crossiella sp. SN42]|uniref:hypothetical protein n=1 Tax=Crossiella sp. SN42 TaxID=2944808 RepID=UPI00207D07D0|nr:hypothetical protein [Crossiella sp. SN42]MCO1577911.1 hypothetical protein [Crossiella sp. SN42]
MLFDGYARSTALLARNLAGNAAPVQSLSGFLQPRLRDFPRVASIMASGEYRDEEDAAPDLKEDVEFGLGRILDGIEILIANRTGRPPGSGAVSG